MFFILQMEHFKKVEPHFCIMAPEVRSQELGLQYVYVWIKRLVCLRFLCRKTTFFIIDPLVWLFLYSVDGSWINLIFCFLIYNPKHRYNNGPRKPCCLVTDCRPQNIISTLSCIKSKSWDPVLQVFLPSKTEFCYEYRLKLGPTNWIFQQSYRRT